MDLRDRFLYWWPVMARILGAGVGLHEAARPVIEQSTLTYGFAAALVAAPLIVTAQRKRNEKRELE